MASASVMRMTTLSPTFRLLILIRFQDEPKGGRVAAWQDHVGLIQLSLSGRN
jgi:hypothetical protein